jgi:hypothetical protein
MKDVLATNKKLLVEVKVCTTRNGRFENRDNTSPSMGITVLTTSSKRRAVV